MNREKTLAGLLSIIALTGCASGKLIEPVPQVPRVPPAEAMALCVDLRPLRDASFASVAKKLDEVSGEYYTCQHKHGELVEWIKRGQEKD